MTMSAGFVVLEAVMRSRHRHRLGEFLERVEDHGGRRGKAGEDHRLLSRISYIRLYTILHTFPPTSAVT